MSHKETKRIATFLEPGTFVGNSSQRYVESLDPYAIVWPENAYAVVLSEREDIVDGKTTYTGPVKGGAITYYHPDSKVETLEQVKNNPRASEVLVSNMECNEWTQIVWTRWGTWPQPFNPKTMAVMEKKHD